MDAGPLRECSRVHRRLLPQRGRHRPSAPLKKEPKLTPPIPFACAFDSSSRTHTQMDEFTDRVGAPPMHRLDHLEATRSVCEEVFLHTCPEIALVRRGDRPPWAERFIPTRASKRMRNIAA